MHILFVCSRNKWRSATAEAIYKNNPHHQVRSAGTASSAVVKVSSKNIVWADIIFTMEKKHKQQLLQKFPIETQQKNIIILEIEDNYHYMDPELVEIIKTSTAPYLAMLSK